MAFPKGTIRLDAAQAIFSDANIAEHRVGGKVAYYYARFDGVLFEHLTLTGLCSELWRFASKQHE